MAQLVFEGEVTALTARQQQFIREVLEKRGFNDGKINIEAVGKAGDNYVANVKRITVEATGGETFKIIAKVAPTSEMTRAMAGLANLFANESTIYGEVLPTFTDLQKSAGISVDEMFRFPESYGILTEEPNELILLEDLQELNFEMLDRFNPLSNECIKLVLKNLAAYHSFSLVLKLKTPEHFEELSKKLNDPVVSMATSPMIGPLIQSVEASALLMLEGDKYKNAVRNKLIKLPELMQKVLKDQDRLKHSVILQGDVWTNNLMFKLQDNEPLECIMIDYQQSRTSNPVWDVLNLLFNCTDHKTRIEHYNNWIDYYHSELEKSLFNFGIKINFIYPRDQFDADLQRYSKLVFALSLLMISMMTTKSEDAEKMKAVLENENEQDLTKAMDSAVIDRNKESLIMMKKKIEGLIDSCRMFGYIE